MITTTTRLVILCLFLQGCFIHQDTSSRVSDGNSIRGHLSSASSIDYPVDTGFHFTQYIERDSAGAVNVIGQYLNGKKDGCWRYFFQGVLVRTVIYQDGKLIASIKPEAKKQYELIKLFLPDATEREFMFTGSVLQTESSISDSVTTINRFNSYGKDTSILYHMQGDDIVYTMMRGRDKRMYSMLVPVNDTNFLIIDLKSKTYRLK